MRVCSAWKIVFRIPITSVMVGRVPLAKPTVVMLMAASGRWMYYLGLCGSIWTYPLIIFMRLLIHEGKCGQSERIRANSARYYKFFPCLGYLGTGYSCWKPFMPWQVYCSFRLDITFGQNSSTTYKQITYFKNCCLLNFKIYNLCVISLGTTCMILTQK